MSEPVPSTSTDQVPRERAAGQVSDVLLNLEHTLARAKKAHKIVAKDGVDTNVELALAEAIKDLERVRKRLQQDTYFAGDSLRMLSGRRDRPKWPRAARRSKTPCAERQGACRSLG